MYLKKVDIQGFKSFADKTEVEFKEEITAIVGPNGSGKSNISDAIRWVLGEQSIKSLRGSKMEDIIFAGTDKRRALGYAEVTITFDNKSGMIPIDYLEVAVTRRMFRSGESEYYINKNSCRLKDIRELFMDTGVGKDGYSIIGQGKIEEILSNKPEDRRNIFEEAAGIIKFKTKKEEAQRKLEKTENNIIRIKDLIFEVTKQKDVLEEEADKATKFTRLFSHLKDLEVNLFIRDIRKLERQITEINIEKEKLNNDILLIEEEKGLIEANYNSLKLNIQEIETRIEESRTIKFDTIQFYEKNRNQISILTEKENYLNKDLERLYKEKTELSDSITNLESSKVDLISELDSIDNKLGLMKEEFSTKSKLLSELNSSLTNEESYLEKSKNDLVSYYNLISDKRSEINSITSFNENIYKRINQINKDIDNIEENKNNILDRDASLKQTEKSLKLSHENNKVELNKLIYEKSDLEKKYKENDEKLKSNEIRLNGLNSSYNLFKNMEEGYEGYYKSVKELLKVTKKNENLNKGFIGVVADLLQVDEKYEKAIDISLGSSVQNLVVETEEDAKKMVQYLKSNKLGRATFLPKNIIKGRSLKLDSNDIGTYNILGLGHELISYDPKYHNIFENLLGRTIIIDNIDNGIRLANKYGHIYKIVTLDGEVLNSGGSITGGTYGNNSISIINRKNRIKELEKDINKTNLDISFLEESKAKVEASLINLNDKSIVCTNKLKDIETSLLDNENEQKRINLEINRLDEEIKKKKLEIITLNSENDELLKNKEVLFNEQIELEKKTNEIKEYSNKIQSTINSKRNIRSSIDIEVTDLRISINLMENTQNNIQNKLDNFYTDKSQSQNLVGDKEKEISLINQELKSISEKKIVLEDEIKNQETNEEEISIKLNELIKNKDVYMKTFYNEQDRLKVINNKLSGIERQRNNLDIRLAKYELQLENLHIKLSEDYELIFEEALKYEKDIENIQSANQEVKELKATIKELGNINISSIEEFGKVKERYEFITTQHLDLVNAKENLKEVIKDMEKNMRSQFVASFEDINKNFTETFSVLFNGGKARLELEDGEDILTAGIEIMAQPPGKKLQSLTLLSGGEKSLTAVALLFAILKTKPAPFCILDEIDAALDEANISRYTNYLKSFNDMTQFVLITHRKTTMEIADVLYGVTMEEEGVSKLISVKLKDNLEQAS